jgi:phosphate transport system substrate-binding protein
MKTAFKMKSLVASLGLITASLVSTAAFAGAGDSVDKGIPEYTKTSGVSGNLSSVGSDTLSNLITLWAEEFKRLYPNVNIQIQGAGSSTAPPAITEGTANIGPMSRLMKDNEIAAFEKKHGYKPTGCSCGGGCVSGVCA